MGPDYVEFPDVERISVTYSTTYDSCALTKLPEIFDMDFIREMKRLESLLYLCKMILKASGIKRLLNDPRMVPAWQRRVNEMKLCRSGICIFPRRIADRHCTGRNYRSKYKRK